MRRLIFTNPKREKLLHVEVPLGIVNIRIGEVDHVGREVNTIELVPDNYPKENKVVARGGPHNTKLVRLKVTKGGINCQKART